MSDFWLIFIPEEPSFKPSKEQIGVIKSQPWYSDNVAIHVNNIIEFADAGSNFESVSCPFCGFDLMDWWGSAMDEAYSTEVGFIILDIVTPCCREKTTLHDLSYDSPQGFYSTMIEMQAYLFKGVIQIPQELHRVAICQELFKITNMKWRIINRHI